MQEGYYDLCYQLRNLSEMLTDDDVASGILLELFERTSLSYTDLAGKTGLSRSTVWDVMHGKKKPSVNTWARIAHALAVEVMESYEKESF